MDAADNVMVTGALENGAAASAHIATIPWNGSGWRMEVYGTQGHTAGQLGRDGPVRKCQIAMVLREPGSHFNPWESSVPPVRRPGHRTGRRAVQCGPTLPYHWRFHPRWRGARNPISPLPLNATSLLDLLQQSSDEG